MPKTQALPGVCQAVWHRQEPVSSPAFHLSMVLAAVTVHSPRRRLVASVETVPTAAQVRFEHLGHDQIKCGVSARRPRLSRGGWVSLPGCSRGSRGRCPIARSTPARARPRSWGEVPLRGLGGHPGRLPAFLRPMLPHPVLWDPRPAPSTKHHGRRLPEPAPASGPVSASQQGDSKSERGQLKTPSSGWSKQGPHHRLLGLLLLLN